MFDSLNYAHNFPNWDLKIMFILRLVLKILYGFYFILNQRMAFPMINSVHIYLLYALPSILSQRMIVVSGK